MNKNEDNFTEPKLARQWLNSGRFFRWTSALAENKSFGELNIFSIQRGDATKPPIVMIHGYPTSSFDFMELFDLLSMDYFVCALDTPGYGFSDKRRNGYTYSLEDDARLVNYYIAEVLNVKKLTLVTHDKGNSVGLALLNLYKKQDRYAIGHLILTNGNIYLPLANLTRFQKILLNRLTGPVATKFVTGKTLANGLNRTTHAIKESPEKVRSNAFILDYQNGGHIQHDIIQYLNQRKQYEVHWLENLRDSDVPTTLVWGEDDRIASTKVSDYVWANYLKVRSAQSNYWIIPTANHYVQNDRPEILSKLIRQSFGERVDFQEISEEEKPYRKLS
ncbi:MAG: alpha/beta hydrolase [Halobacteriota archaeon]|jgi:pimeloyl-ACP methyl ester carboxylesterase